jgi:hypothetical protein
MATELIAATIDYFRLLLKITSLSFVYRITVLVPYSLWISVFLGPSKSYFRNAATAWMKQNRQRKITRYKMARLIGFALDKASIMGVNVSAVESTVIYPMNRNRVPEYFFSNSDTSETVTFMETTSPDMAQICVPSTSGTNSKNTCILPISAEPSVINLNTTLPADNSAEEATPSRLLKISPVQKILRKYSISEKKSFVPTEEANDPEEKRKNQDGNKVKEQRKIESINSLNTSGLQDQKIQKTNSLNKVFIIKRNLKILTRNVMRAGKTTCK